MRTQRGAECLRAHLAVDLAAVIARGRAERDATATPLRRSDRALACAAGALLAPRLLATTADFAAVLGGVGPGTAMAEFRDDGLVDQVGLDLLLGDRPAERGFACEHPFGVEHGDTHAPPRILSAA